MQKRGAETKVEDLRAEAEDENTIGYLNYDVFVVAEADRTARKADRDEDEKVTMYKVGLDAQEQKEALGLIATLGVGVRAAEVLRLVPVQRGVIRMGFAAGLIIQRPRRPADGVEARCSRGTVFASRRRSG